mgnify:CR=1 FL=1
MPVTCLPVGRVGKFGKPAWRRQEIGKLDICILPAAFPFFPPSRPETDLFNFITRYF